MGNHPRILNLLLVFVLVSLSSVAVFLASDILSSGSHAVQKNGFDGLLQQIPKDPFAALNFWRDAGKAANKAPAKISGLNGSNKTKEKEEEVALARNTSQASTISSSSSPNGPLALRQASGITTSGIVAGSTNISSTPATKRNHSGGGQSKKAKRNDSRTIGSPSNESRSDASQLNGSQENKSQTNESQPNWAPLTEPLQNRSSLNASQPAQSQKNQSESINQSQMSDSQSNETQLSQANTTNQSQPTDLQPALAEPKNQTPSAESPAGQLGTLARSEGEIRTAPSVVVTGSDGAKNSYLPDNASNTSVGSWVGSSGQSQRRTTSAALSPSNSKPKAGDVTLEPAAKESNPPEALRPHQEKTVDKTDKGASLQGELQNKSQAESSRMANQTLTDSSSSRATGTDAGKVSDAPAAKTLNLDSAQEKNNDKVPSNSSGKGDKAVSASKSTAKIQNAKKEGSTNQYRPVRAPRKPAQPRQVRSALRR